MTRRAKGRRETAEQKIERVRTLGAYHARMAPLTRTQFLDHFGWDIEDAVIGAIGGPRYTARELYGLYLQRRNFERQYGALAEEEGDWTDSSAT